MTKTIAILALALALAAAGLSACAKSTEQNVTTENIANTADAGPGDNLDEVASNGAEPAGIENIANAS